MLPPVPLPCTPPAITVQAKPESGPHTVLLAVAGVPALPGVGPSSPATPAPRSVRPYDHLGACFMPFIQVVPFAQVAETFVQPVLPRAASPVAAPAPAPRP